MASLSLKHIYKVYPNGAKAVNDFNMEIEDKEFVVLVGPSGCGKSTTLRMIAGLEEISSGEFYIDGVYANNLQPAERDMAMVFQNYALYPHMTIYDNIAFGLRIRKLPKKEIDERVRNAAKILGITEYLNRKPKQMSGGQRQRVALGRAIVREPKVMLLDEPLSNLDAKLRTTMRSEISKLHKRLNTTFIYVTHDQVEAMTMGTIIVVMKDGFVQQIDRPQNLYNYPVNKFVAGFIGTPQMNFFSVTMKKTEGGAEIAFADAEVRVTVPAENLYKLREKYLDGRKKLIIGLRPEDIHIADKKSAAGAKIKVKVANVEEMGSEALVYGDINTDADVIGESNTRIIIKAQSGIALNIGDVIEVTPDTKKLHIFDAETENTLMPHLVEFNDVACSIKDNVISYLGQSKKLPAAMACPDGEGYITISSSAVKITTDGIKASVVGCEQINKKYLIALNAGEKRLYCLADAPCAVGEVYIDIDLKHAAIETGDFRIDPLSTQSELDADIRVGRYDAAANKVKHARNSEAVCYTQINGVIEELPDSLASKITANYTRREISKRKFRITFSPYGVSISEEGIEGTVEKMLDYGDEKFALVKVGDKSVIVSVGGDVSGKVHLSLDYDKIGVTDARNDIKIV